MAVDDDYDSEFSDWPDDNDDSDDFDYEPPRGQRVSTALQQRNKDLVQGGMQSSPALLPDDDSIPVVRPVPVRPEASAAVLPSERSVSLTVNHFRGAQEIQQEKQCAVAQYERRNARVNTNPETNYYSDSDDESGSNTAENSLRSKRAPSSKNAAEQRNDKAPSRGKKRSLHGKFAKYVMLRSEPEISDGRNVKRRFCGMLPTKVKMNYERHNTIVGLMKKHNNFEGAPYFKSTEATVDYLQCLMILDEASLENKHCRGSRYPRYLKVFIGPDRFFDLEHKKIEHSQRKDAEAWMRNYARNVLSETNKCKGVPFKEASVKAQDKKVTKLTGDHMHGVDEYLKLCDKVANGELKLPDPEASFAVEE